MPNVFVVYSLSHKRLYTLILLPIKYTNMYKIVNVTTLYITPYTFSSIEEAIADIYKYQYNKKNKVITKGIYYNIVRLICKLSNGRLKINKEETIWF